jgi:hypothetical protein
MSYKYEDEKKRLFTEDGVKTIIFVRDQAKALVKIAGCFTAEKLLEKCAGDSFTILAVLDFLVEIGELRVRDELHNVSVYVGVKL